MRVLIGLTNQSSGSYLVDPGSPWSPMLGLEELLVTLVASVSPVQVLRSGRRRPVMSATVSVPGWLLSSPFYARVIR